MALSSPQDSTSIFKHSSVNKYQSYRSKFSSCPVFDHIKENSINYYLRNCFKVSDLKIEYFWSCAYASFSFVKHAKLTFGQRGHYKAVLCSWCQCNSRNWLSPHIKVFPHFELHQRKNDNSLREGRMFDLFVLVSNRQSNESWQKENGLMIVSLERDK